jgi:hypothetical protein
MQQVGGYLGYTGRAADVIAKAALDPQRSFEDLRQVIVNLPPGRPAS